LESSGIRSDPADYSRGLYAELHALAARWLRDQRKNHTLQATELVHEAFLRLHAGRELAGQDRVGFLALASTAMRCALVDHARTRGRLKRSPPGEQLPVDALLVEYEDRAIDMLALDEALRRLDTFDPDMASAVELRFFGGLSAKEASAFLGIPLRTFERRWSAVRAWLRAEVG
jgi:RNA polymerase sigma factor (TIGR02999 family)